MGLKHTTSIVTAFGDESVRMTGHPPFYMLGAVTIEREYAETMRALSDLKPSNATKLHWRDMGYKQQRRSLEIIMELELQGIVAIARPLNGRKQERARRKCLEVLVNALDSAGAGLLVLETRDDVLDTRDIEFVKGAKAAMRIGPLAVTHKSPESCQQLWIPDQVIGAMGDTLTQAGNWNRWQAAWSEVEQKVDIIEVQL